MKKYVSLFLALIMIFTLASCGGRTDENTTVSLPAVSAERAALEQVGAIATQQYIIARLKTDVLIEYDIENGSIDELKAMTDDTLEAWRLCELASVKAAELTDYAQSLRSSASTQAATISYTSSKPAMIDLFNTVAYAAEENAAVKWAKELTEKYDSYPAGQKVKQLADNLGTDAKKAYAQLQMAQNILTGEAYSAEGDTMQKFEKAAMATKTACKTGLYIGGVVAGGGVANGILEAGGMVIGGVDTIADIASTGSTIICGENNRITMAANDLKDLMGPISSVAGGVNVLTGGIKFAGTAADKMGSIDKLSYIGESVLDLVSEGKILGGTITVGKDGKTTVTTKEIDLEGKTTDEVEKELEKAGLSLPEDEDPKTTAELAEEMEEKYFYTEEEINEIIENLRQLLYDMFLEEEPEKEEKPAEKPAVIGLPLEEVLGTYSITFFDDGESETANFTFMYYEGNLVFKPEKALAGFLLIAGPYKYDPSTATATCEVESEGLSAYAKVSFVSENGVIRLTSSSTMTMKGTATINGEGIKIE